MHFCFSKINDTETKYYTWAHLEKKLLEAVSVAPVDGIPAPSIQVLYIA